MCGPEIRLGSIGRKGTRCWCLPRNSTYQRQSDDAPVRVLGGSHTSCARASVSLSMARDRSKRKHYDQCFLE